MADKDNTASKDERQKRLAAQLRANLARRKAQARSRRSGEADGRSEGVPSLKQEKKD